MTQELSLPVKESPKILIIEDEMIIARDIQMQLNRLGFVVTAIVSTAADAFQTIETNPPELVLMDIRIKGDVDGVEAAEIVRSRYRLPVVYLTSHADTATVQRAQVTEPFGYIQKPLGNLNLEAMLLMALHKHRQERQRENNRNLLSAILDSISDAVLVADAGGEALFLNRAAEQLTGWTLKESAGRSLVEVTPIYAKDGREISAALLHDAVTQRMPVPIPQDSVLMSKEGVAVEISGQFAPTSLANLPAGVCLTLRDVTAEKRKAESLRQEKQMFVASELAHGIALEFYALFDLIEGTATDLLEHGLDKDRTSELHLLRKASRAGAGMSSQLFELRESHGSAHAVNISEHLLTLQPMLQRLCGDKVRLEISSDPNAGYILITGNHIEQLLLHLVLEGKRRVDPEGTLMLHADVEREAHSSRPYASYVRLCLRAEKSNANASAGRQPGSLEIESPQLGLAVVRAMAIASEGFSRIYETSPSHSVVEVFLPRRDSRLAAGRAANEAFSVVMLIGLQPRFAESFRAPFTDSVFLLEAASLKEAILISELYEGEIDLIVQNESQVSVSEIQDAHLRIRAYRPKITVLQVASPDSGSGVDQLDSTELERWIIESLSGGKNLPPAANQPPAAEAAIA